MLAGKTKIKRTIIANEENFLVFLNNNNIPSIISINPLKRTTSFFHFIKGGTIATKNSVSIKCLNPTYKYNSAIT